jgi:hypothetical protein
MMMMLILTTMMMVMMIMMMMMVDIDDDDDDCAAIHVCLSSGPGCFYFGADATKAFLQHNGLSLLVRSHEVFQSGFELFHNGMLYTWQ